MSAPPPNAGALVGTRLGDYELVALLALGGTAEIYLARVGGHAGFEKYVVVKCLHDHLAYDPEFVQMFLDEARLGAQLDHSNIVQTLALGEQDGRYYLVMEYVAGMSLALMARRTAERVPGSRIPPPLVLGLASQAAAGLHYAHERQSGGHSLNLVHRDISPQNLVVTFEGVVKIVDFGIAKAEERATATRAGTIKGKFAYMSPEQCVAKHVDRRTDVFALGVVVHELLTGRRLFKRNSTYETYQAILECKVPPPSAVNHELDPALDRVVMAALAKDADRRYQSAEAFGEAIAAYLHRGGKQAGPGAISTFIESYFLPEIADHGDRMRELLEGRAAEAMGWGDGDEAEELSGRELVEDGAHPGPTGFEDGPTAGDDGEAPVDSTRIEMNPLERLAELNEQVRRSGAFPAANLPTMAAPVAAVAAARPMAPASLAAPLATVVAPQLAPQQAGPRQTSPQVASPQPSPQVASPQPSPQLASPQSSQHVASPQVAPPPRNPGPPAPLFSAAKPGGSIFGSPTKAPAAGAAPAPSAAPAEPLKIASLFGGNTPIAKGRRSAEQPAARPPMAASPAASLAAAAPTQSPAAAQSRAGAPAPARAPLRSGVFGPSVVPTVLAEPEPTPASRTPVAAPGAATMALELQEVISDLERPAPAGQGRPRSRAEHHTEPAPVLPPGYQHLAYGTPPGTPSSGEPSGFVHTPLPVHLIDLPPADVIPNWDGTFRHPRRGMPPWLLIVLFLVAIGAATGITVLIARAVA